jgi:hypothetical protein
MDVGMLVMLLVFCLGLNSTRQLSNQLFLDWHSTIQTYKEELEVIEGTIHIPSGHVCPVEAPSSTTQIWCNCPLSPFLGKKGQKDKSSTMMASKAHISIEAPLFENCKGTLGARYWRLREW